MAFSRFQHNEYRPGLRGFSFFPPVIKYLIIINVGAYFLQELVLSGMFTVGGMPLGRWFQLTFYLWPIGSGEFHVWQPITYMFLHGGFWHLFLNMLMLWMFGMEVENTWGLQKFLVFYFVCGITAALANLFVAPLFAEPGPTIGASGGVYGVLVAFAMMFPNRYVYIYFLLPVKAKYLISFFIVLEVFNGVTGSMDGVAHMAHLGGAVIGALWVILDSRGSIDRIFRALQSGKGLGFSDRTKPARGQQVREAQFHEINPQPKESKQSGESDAYQKVIDEILDKIGKSGYSALTEEEKKILLDASRKLHPGG